MIKPAYSVSFLLSINIFVWQNVRYFLDAPPILCQTRIKFCTIRPQTGHCSVYANTKFSVISAYHVIRIDEILGVRQGACPGIAARLRHVAVTGLPERTGTKMAEQADLKQYDGSQRGSQPVWQELELTDVILRFSLFSDVTHSILVNIHRRFGNTCPYYLLKSSLILERGTLGCSET